MSAALIDRHPGTAGVVVGVCAALVACALDFRLRLALGLIALLAVAVRWMMAAPQNWVNGLLISTLVLPPLPIALGNSGPHVAILFAAFGIFAGVAAKTRWRAPQDLAAWALLAWLAAATFSLTFAFLYSGAAVAAASLARIFLLGISVYVYLYLTCGPGRSSSAGWPGMLRWVLIAGVVSAVFACLDFRFHFPVPAGFGPQFVWLDSGVYRRAQGFFYEASTLGNVCAFFLTGLVVCVLRRVRPASLGRAGMAVASLTCLAALILSYSRASLVALGVATGAALLVSSGRRGRALAWCGVLLPLAAVAAWVIFPSFLQLYWDRLSGSASFFLRAPGAVLSGRLDSWRTLAEFLNQHRSVLLTGVGYKTLPYGDLAGHPVVADNMYLSSLVETGIGGFAALLFLNAAVLRTSFRAARSADAAKAFLGTWVFSFWCGEVVQMMSGDLMTYWRILPVYFWVLAMAVRSADEHLVSRAV